MPHGPVDALRASPSGALLPAANRAAQAAGMTRLADVTRLDRIGFPVWQAVRPMSSALSVHQGKGATESDAQLGALLEASESHAAESFEAEGPVCRFAALPKRARAGRLDDFAADRDNPPSPDRCYRWVEATDLLTGKAIFLPFDVVSLDLSRNIDSAFDRASNGIATGATRQEAITTALHEFLERDAVTEWQAGGLFARMERTVELASVPFAWLRFWRDRIEAAGADLLVYHVPSLTGAPVFACEINDLGKDGTPYRAVQGLGCHPVPEIALFKAVAEALQSRTTYIAGARDDMLPSDYRAPPGSGILIAFGLPLPPDMNGVDFTDIVPGAPDPISIAETIQRSGYGPVAIVDLGRPEGLHIVRVFVGGLGSMCRRRRRPVAA